MLNATLRQRSATRGRNLTERSSHRLRGAACVLAQTRSTAATSTKTGKRRAKRRAQPKLPGPLEQGHDQRHEEGAAVPTGGLVCDAVVELNVGGTLMSTFLSTLTQVPGSRLARMFGAGGRLQRDSAGRVFLDYDPHCFALLLTWLRDRRMQHEAAGGGALPQGLTPEEQHHLAHLVQHLQLAPHHAAAPAPLPLLQRPPSPPLPRLLNTPLVQPVPMATGSGAAPAARRPKPCAAPPKPPTPHPTTAPACTADKGGAKASHLEAGQGEPGTAAPRDRAAPDGAARHVAASLVGSYQPAAGRHTRALPAASSGKAAAINSGSGGSSSRPQRPRGRAAAGQAQGAGAGCTGPSALYYVMAGRERRKGLRISVLTERDLAALRAAPRFDLFCDASFLPPHHMPLAAPASMALSVVATRELQDLFLGITSRAHTDQRGTSVPCYGWKQLGCRYSSAGPAEGGSGEAAAASMLWRKGDCVEVRLQAAGGLQLQLRVNGELVDVLQPLPQLAEWCWYLGLYSHGDLSSVVLHPDSYAVYWGDYHIRRYL